MHIIFFLMFRIIRLMMMDAMYLSCKSLVFRYFLFSKVSSYQLRYLIEDKGTNMKFGIWNCLLNYVFKNIILLFKIYFYFFI
jgi:hypothetical protein